MWQKISDYQLVTWPVVMWQRNVLVKFWKDTKEWRSSTTKDWFWVEIIWLFFIVNCEMEEWIIKICFLIFVYIPWKKRGKLLILGMPRPLNLTQSQGACDIVSRLEQQWTAGHGANVLRLTWEGGDWSCTQLNSINCAPPCERGLKELQNFTCNRFACHCRSSSQCVHGRGGSY